jgi:hypothetical protein
MAANVRIEDEAFNDPRIEALATIAGYNRYEALGRLAHLWRVCTQREAYILSEVQISGCLGTKGPVALVEAELGERVEGGIRIKGTEGRIEWLQKLRASAKAGGAANKSRLEAKRMERHTQATAKPSGYPNGSSGEPQLSQMASRTGATTQAEREPLPKPNGSPSTSSTTSTFSEADICSEAGRAPPSEPSALTFPVVGKQPSKEWQLTESKLGEYRESFPGVDVLAQARAARQWCIDNRAKRKTPIGMPGFLTRWFTKAQNDAGRNRAVQAHAPSKPLLNPPNAAPMAFGRKGDA